MKKSIIYGVCAVAFLLLITPTIPAQQYKLMAGIIETDFQQHLEHVIVSLRCIDEDVTQIDYQREIVLKSFHEIKQMQELGCFDALPTCFKFIIRTLLSLIFSIIGTILGVIFGKLFGPLLVFLVKVITFPAKLLAKILEFLFNENRLIAT